MPYGVTPYMCFTKLLKNTRFCKDFWNWFEHIWNSYFSSIINDINKSRGNTDGMNTISIWACHVRAAEPPRYADCSPNRAPLYGVLALNRTGCPLHTPRKVSAVWLCCIKLLKNTRFCKDSGIYMATFCSRIAWKPMLFYGPLCSPVRVLHEIVEKHQVL